MVVVYRNAWVVEKAHEPAPHPRHVRDRLAEPALGQRRRVRRECPGAQFVDDRACADVAHDRALLIARGAALAESLERVERPDQGERFGRAWEGRLALHKLSPHVGPAVREHEGAAALGERLVTRIPVAHHRADVAVEELTGGVLRAVLEEPVVDAPLDAERPDVPALGRAAARLGAHQAPPRLVGADDREGEHPIAKARVRGREQRRGGVALIPERLRIDDEPFAPEDAHHAFERQMVHVLADDDLGHERERIPSTVGEPLGAGRREHARAARAAVLLPLVPLDHEVARDHVDLVARLELPGPHAERVLAERAAAGLVGRERVLDLFDRQRGLWPRAVARVLRPLLGLALARPLLRRVAEELLALLREVGLELREAQLQFLFVFALGAQELLRQLEHLLHEPRVLALEQFARLPQQVEVGLLLPTHHRRARCTRTTIDKASALDPVACEGCASIAPRRTRTCRAERSAEAQRALARSEDGRAERQAADGVAALEKEGELAHRPTQGSLARLPGGGESTFLETLRKQTESGAVKIQGLRPRSRFSNKEVNVAGQERLAHRLDDERAERVERLPHIDGLGIRVDGDLAGRTDHASLRTSSTACSNVRPSTRRPPGPCTTRWPDADGETGSTTTGRKAGRGPLQRTSVGTARPSSSASWRKLVPRARRSRTWATTRWRRASG